ncbi:EAL domain-containing protein [Marinobacter sp. SS13-12]|uniref:EAL domain-containing protein n=1 Tax=Marinobacter sp. SS13-12 TaxID=3050451 RepID=UPI0025542374|nr:EAL domain-containing protein [Marinobacter sp. SS13-12]MDK8462224.1 EAL domain-containing protein [Marinobacter sp. SS13-12]
MNEPVAQYTKHEPVIELRPFVSPGSFAAPSFEVLAWSARSVVGVAPAILNFFDCSLPAIYRGTTRVSFSLDAGEVFDKSFPQDLLKEIEWHNIDPPRLWLEICESSVLNETAWQRVIPELADCGFKVVVKRFIADYSGFDILASPHIAGIKAAPPVVAALPYSILPRRFLKGLQSLANAVNKQLIVDGVETLGQALWLEAMGCEMLQGSFYGPAMDASKARSFILEGRQCIAPIVFNPVTA